MNGDIETTKLLLYRKADVNLKAKNGLTAVHIAAYYGYSKLLAFLLSQGASLEAKDSEGTSNRAHSN
jgi:ankyrin repeat protein